MINRWRSEIESGREQATQLGERMTMLVWRMIEVAFVAGFVLGAALAIGAALLWQTR